MSGDTLVVVSMITRNSLTKLASKRSVIRLRDVLDSTLQIPYKTFILVDDSTDETPNFVKRWCEEHDKEIIVSRSRLYGFHRPTRATARQTAIDIFFENTSDEWLMFVDDDVVLQPGWWEEAKQYIENPRIGIIWGINWDGTPFRKKWLEFFGINYEKYLVDEFFRRGGEHDTLHRREALEGIRIPPELHVFEDWYILKYILSKGYEAVVLRTGCIHYNPWDTFLPREELKWMATLAKKYGIEPSNLGYRLKRFLRTLAGLPLNLYLSMRVYGWREGLKRGYMRWRTKLLYRWYALVG